MRNHAVLQDKELSTAQISDREWQAKLFLGVCDMQHHDKPSQEK